jgi:hypothetical protein
MASIMDIKNKTGHHIGYLHTHEDGKDGPAAENFKDQFQFLVTELKNKFKIRYNHGRGFERYMHTHHGDRCGPADERWSDEVTLYPVSNGLLVSACPNGHIPSGDYYVQIVNGRGTGNWWHIHGDGRLGPADKKWRDIFCFNELNPLPQEEKKINIDAGLLQKLNSISVGEVVTRSPRDIMRDVLLLQGIHVDPMKAKAAVHDLCEVMGSGGFGDGSSTFDCFISYRVAADHAFVQSLYWALKAHGMEPFWDQESLAAGSNWRDGFLRGLKRSKYFIAVISREALSPLRREGDHSEDNVLLEYETALAVHNRLGGERKYFIPLLLGQHTNAGYVAFGDFDRLLYVTT